MSPTFWGDMDQPPLYVDEDAKTLGLFLIEFAMQFFDIGSTSNLSLFYGME